MSSDLFPQIDPAAVARMKLVQQMVDDDPSYLDNPDCPYPEAVKEFFRKRIKMKQADGPIDLEEETGSLYATLKDYGDTLKGEDTKEYMAWIKTLVQVQERLLGLQERAKSVKHVKMFEAAVFAALENLEPHVRTEIIDKLKAAAA